ncbi:RDD family protein [Kitasatospora sp. NPDC101155]|uniref:RDD family protein n=1 Tax=Kitasatospora sp. NPDC101155 TaxID=3364097 RepID=UPI0037F9B032
MADRPFAADGDPAVAPGPGYYPDPSIPGFVRYWGGSAWVPGTTRPSPAEGEVLEPPRFAARRPAPDVAAARAVPPPTVPQARSHSPSPLPSDLPAPSPSPASSPSYATSGDTGPVYLDQTTGGASFVVGPRVAEVIGGPVFRTVEPAAQEAPGASGWQADPQAQWGLMETGGAPRWVSWGVLPGAPEAEEGHAEAELAPVAVEVAAAVAPAMATVVREAPTPVAAAGAVPVVEAQGETVAETGVGVESAVEAAGGASGVGPKAATATAPVRSGPASAPASASAPDSAAALPAVRPAREAAVRRRPAPAVPAGLGRRLAARAVDTGVLLVVAVAAGIPLGRSVADHLQQKLDQAKMASFLTRRQVQVWLVDDVVVGKLAVLLGILMFVSLLYEVLPTARTGQTFGKRLARIRVVDATEPGRTRLSLGRSLLRWVVRQLGLVLPLGLVWPVFDRPARRGWQDRAARTRVVRS